MRDGLRFCNGKTALVNGDFLVELEDGMMRVYYRCSTEWYATDISMEINNCPMCGEKLGDAE